ncbi:MAG: BrnT family toxin [Proteobacteria bacterium]|nr:BrnT family toxin [Pseudomonadota bacterium]MBS0464629.1 BrnT family toxin [Pseudomonadota bacterium]
MVTYDETKRAANLLKHGFDFVGADAIFAGFTISREDTSEAYGELRLQTLGLWNGVVVFVVHTPRGDADHVISIRKAEKHEERIYWKNYPG